MSSIRTRLMVVTIVGLVVTMIGWGWIQLAALDRILTRQQLNKLYEVAKTVGTYYQHFPSGLGLSALDVTLKEQLKSDFNFARIDLFTVSDAGTELIAGTSRVAFEWPDAMVADVAATGNPRHIKAYSDTGPVLGLLYPAETGIDTKHRPVVGVMSFSNAEVEILSRAKTLLTLATIGLLCGIVLILVAGYHWIIGGPLKSIMGAIDDFHDGEFAQRIPEQGAWEWVRLAARFNAMADEIQRVLARDRELNRQLERRVLEETGQVVALQNEVNQLQRLTTMGYFTATLAHDMGTPLHSIAGLARLLLERGDWASDAKRKLELIVQQADRLDLVIQNVRRASRLPDPHFEAVPVADLFHDILPLLEPLIQQAGIQIALQVAPDLGPLHADRYRLQTALFNLVQNALEALAETADGQVVLFAGPGATPNAVAISVSDNGPGISPEIRDRIFDPFVSTRTRKGLCGIGLTIVRDIVHIHGGQIRIDRSDGSGTRMTMELPTASLNTAIP
jgi:two-component system NtrC family sensor kinase